MLLSGVFGWIALSLIPATAIVAWIMRRAGTGAFLARMRPHFILGYAALAFAMLHLSMSMGGMRGANTSGVWFATIALFAVILQAFLGSNLQSPGAYRKVLRRWHIATFIAALAFALGHVLLNG